MHLRLEGRAQRLARHGAARDVNRQHRGDGHSEEDQQQGRHQDLEREGEHEEADVLAEHGIEHAEALGMAPEQIGLPVLGHAETEQAADDQSRSSESDEPSAPSDHPGPATRHQQVGPEDDRDRAGDQRLELDLGRHDAREQVRLPQLVEPQGVRKRTDRGIGDQDRKAEHHDHDRGAPTGSEEERPPVDGLVLDRRRVQALGRREVTRPGHLRLGHLCLGHLCLARRWVGHQRRTRRRRRLRRCVGLGGASGLGTRREHGSSAAPVQPAVLRKERVESLGTDFPHVAASPRALLAAQLTLAQQRSHGLRTRSESLGDVGNAEAPPHPEKLPRRLSQPQRKHHDRFPPAPAPVADGCYLQCAGAGRAGRWPGGPPCGDRRRQRALPRLGSGGAGVPGPSRGGHGHHAWRRP